MSTTNQSFHDLFKRTFTEGEVSYIRGSAICFMGTAIADVDETSGEAVVIVASNRESLEKYLTANKIPFLQRHLSPVAILQQSKVKVIDDL